ncbi:hypothetical protein AB7W46_00865 [Providencia rettgeri]
MSLAIIILLIILVPAIPFFCLLKKRKWKFWLDESSLHVQPLFWFLVFLPLIISGIAWVLVAQDYELDVSTRGYSRLMENAKFPFLILALSPILGAFVTSAHRSLQTELQIKTAKTQLNEIQKKNKVDLYYSSRKYISEQLQSIQDRNNEPIKRPTTLYMSAYTISDDYNDEVKHDFYQLINSYLIDLIYNLDILIEVPKNIITMRQNFDPMEFASFNTHLANIDAILREMKKLFFIKPKSGEGGISVIHSLRLENLKQIEQHEYIKENMACVFLSVDLSMDITDILDITKEVFLVLSPTKSIDKVLLNYSNVHDKLDETVVYLRKLCEVED